MANPASGELSVYSDVYFAIASARGGSAAIPSPRRPPPAQMGGARSLRKALKVVSGVLCTCNGLGWQWGGGPPIAAGLSKEQVACY